MEQFGEKFKTSKGTVNNWEKGRNLPNKDRLKQIADYDNITVEQLLYGDLKSYVLEVLEDDFNSGDSKLYEPFIEYLRIKDKQYGEVESGITFNAETGKMNSHEEHLSVLNEFANFEFQRFVSDNIEDIYKQLMSTNTDSIQPNYDKEFIISSTKRYLELRLLADSLQFEGKVNQIINIIRLQYPGSSVGDSTIEELIQMHFKMEEPQDKAKSEKDLIDSGVLDAFSDKEKENIINNISQEREKLSDEEIINDAITHYYESKLGDLLRVYLDELKQLLTEYEQDLEKYLPKDETTE